MRRREKKESQEQGGGGRGGTGGGRQRRKGEAGIHSRGRKGWCEREEGGGGKACTPTRATFSRSFLRSFVRFFVMTVDETMTYFSGFSLPGCPAALPFTPSLVLPSPFRPLSPGCTPPRVHPGCLRSSRHPQVLRVFLSGMSRGYSSSSPPSLNPFLEGDLHVKRGNILAIAAE